MVAQPAYSSPPTPNRGSTRWRIAARQISTTRILSRFASRPSRTNLSMTQNKSTSANLHCGNLPTRSRR